MRRETEFLPLSFTNTRAEPGMPHGYSRVSYDPIAMLFSKALPALAFPKTHSGDHGAPVEERPGTSLLLPAVVSF